jgi:UDP-N-acetyl-D-glucosamine dehydrogenase
MEGAHARLEARFIDLASQVNSEMPHYVVSKVTEGLNEHRLSLKGAKVLVLGVAYKKDVKDLRESPALEIVELLDRKGADISYSDPHLPYLKINDIDLTSVKLTKKTLKAADIVVIVTDHTKVDYDFVLEHAKQIVDTRNVLKNAEDRSKIIRL